MSDLINHSEAFELAHYQKANSNVARCYLDHCKTLESLTRELAAAKGEIEGLRKENAQLTNALNPRLWSVEMDHAWHRAIPNLHKAFADLKAAAIAEKSSTNS